VCSPSVPSSRVSAASISVSSGLVCAACGSVRSTRSASEFLRSTGLTCFACGISVASEQASCRPLMSSAVAFPVRTSASPGRGPGSTGSVRVFGASTPVSLANFDPAMSSWRTSQLSLLAEWGEFSETWPRSGMTRSGIASRLQPLAPLTAATDFGLLPTPTATANHMAPSMRKHSGMRLLQDGLLPTPPATMADRGGRGDLLQLVRGNPSPSGHFRWPTPHGMPKVGQARNPGPSGNELGAAVNRIERELWPTPTTQDYRIGMPERYKEEQSMGGRRSNLNDAVAEGKTAATGGALNPTWVEWLMGFPLGWTDCGASATRSSRRSHSGSGNAS
jgi:hypothetical protein